MKQPTSLVQYSFFFIAIVLMAFGVNTMFRVNFDSNMKAIYMVYAVLMLGDALVMLACGLLIGARKIANSLLSLNILLSVFDQFGWVDLFFVLLNAFTLGLVLNLRKEFLPQ